MTTAERDRRSRTPNSIKPAPQLRHIRAPTPSDPRPQLRHPHAPKLRHTRPCRGYLAEPSTDSAPCHSEIAAAERGNDDC